MRFGRRLALLDSNARSVVQRLKTRIRNETGEQPSPP